MQSFNILDSNDSYGQFRRDLHPPYSFFPPASSKVVLHTRYPNGVAVFNMAPQACEGIWSGMRVQSELFETGDASPWCRGDDLLSSSFPCSKYHAMICPSCQYGDGPRVTMVTMA